MIKVKCQICGKEELVYPSRAKQYKTCSVECLSKYNTSKNNAICCVCGHEFHVKPKRLKRITNKFGITCSKICSNKIKRKMYMGRNNPNAKYNLDDNFFKEVKTEEQAYLLGWIASDGTVKKNTITIAIDKKDIGCLRILKDIICSDLPITNKTDTIRSFSINSETICSDVCALLNILPQKKSDVVCFPKLDTDELKWAFLRGFFDGDGSIHNITEDHRSPQCGITTDSKNMRKSIIDFCKIPCVENESNLYWSGNNALDFLDKLYKNSKYRLSRKYDLYLDVSTWVPSVSYSKYYKNEHCTWAKTRKDAISPSKERASDSGYDLVLLEKIKTVGKVDFYDTGIKVKPNFGYYFNLVPRSSISKTGYMLANSIGIIDRTYLGNIMVALIKIDENAPDLQLPQRLVQIIPTQIVHFQMEEVESFDVNATDRGEGGFGSTNK
jgi:deoxyuridine 5'-triphosphate nucleotidohydrolase